MNSTNNISARATYLQARQMYIDAWLGSFGGDRNATANYVDSLVLSQSEIRLETLLTTTNNRFVFGVTPNQANSANLQFNTEQRLNLQDAIVVSEYGIFISNPSSNTDTTYILNTYANGNVFAAADVAGLNSTFYANGYFTAKVNNQVIIPYRGLWNHNYKPQTQQIAPTGITAAQSQIRGAEDGFITVEPNFMLIGSKNSILEIVLPAALTSAAPNLRVHFIARGIVAQNSTVVS
jgi:hypothetical protein